MLHYPHYCILYYTYNHHFLMYMHVYIWESGIAAKVKTVRGSGDHGYVLHGFVPWLTENRTELLSGIQGDIDSITMPA